MVLVIDRASPITLSEAESYRTQMGAPLGIMGYSGGPCALEAWPVNAFAPLRAAGFWVGSFWVGTGCELEDLRPATAQAQGARATTDADRRGILDCPLVLDVEAQTWYLKPRGDVLAYIDNWCASVLAHGGLPWVYGPPSLMSAAASQAGWKGVWEAYYPADHWQPVPAPLAPLSGVQRAWQYAGSQKVVTVLPAVDVSVLDHLPVEGEAVDLDTARAVVFVRLSGEGVLGDQAQVDSYAGQMVAPGANPEAVLTALNTDIAANPAALSNRVAALEAKVTRAAGDL